MWILIDQDQFSGTLLRGSGRLRRLAVNTKTDKQIRLC